MGACAEQEICDGELTHKYPLRNQTRRTFCRIGVTWTDKRGSYAPMLNEFKKFIFRGDVIALSTGVIIGAAFGKVVEAVTQAIVNPLLALLVGKPEFHFGPTIKGVTFDFGLILTALIFFVMTAAVIFFFIVKPANVFMERLKRSEPPAPVPPPSAEEKLLTEIRDLLKNR